MPATASVDAVSDVLAVELSDVVVDDEAVLSVVVELESVELVEELLPHPVKVPATIAPASVRANTF
jgi:hypothetical protein